MKAVDTNILARWIMRDDPAQAVAADDILTEAVFVGHTVLVELAWVLGGKSYALDRRQQLAALETILDLRTVTVPDEAATRWALARFAQGADFADMMHLIGARGAQSFISFERRLAALAGPDTPLPIERPM